MTTDLGANPILPVVLVGGRSTRFGRDKLLEPFGPDSAPLVHMPIGALRAVFGPRVHVVGMCDPRVAQLADGVIPDQHPGVGPLGGILSALERGGDVFVLAGDMPGVVPGDVRAVLDAAAHAPLAWAVLGATDRLHPCLGLYRAAALPTLRAKVRAGDLRLSTALPADHIAGVRLPSAAGMNVNSPGDIGAPGAASG